MPVPEDPKYPVLETTAWGPISVTSATALQPNTAYLASITIKPSTSGTTTDGTMTLYVNGTLAEQKTGVGGSVNWTSDYSSAGSATGGWEGYASKDSGYPNSPDFFSGSIGEVLDYARVLDGTPRSSIESYLKTKFGLATTPAPTPIPTPTATPVPTRRQQRRGWDFVAIITREPISVTSFMAR